MILDESRTNPFYWDHTVHAPRALINNGLHAGRFKVTQGHQLFFAFKLFLLVSLLEPFSQGTGETGCLG